MRELCHFSSSGSSPTCSSWQSQIITPYRITDWRGSVRCLWNELPPKPCLMRVTPSIPFVDAHVAYSLGKIAGHNIVVASLPTGIYGTNSATAVVSHIKSTFDNIRSGLMAGIAGGGGRRYEVSGRERRGTQKGKRVPSATAGHSCRGRQA